MRLIDADDLILRLEKHWGILNLGWFINCIKQSPTVEIEKDKEEEK